MSDLKQPTVISVDNATVRFNMSSEKIDTMKEYFVRLAKRKLYFKEFFALKNVNFQVKKGESWGIVGNNGAGKSTLLRLICGIINPYEGNISINGSISPLLELGAGFDTQLTASENIYLQGSLMGYSRSFMKERYDEIVDFSELEEFLEMPIKNYSTGMIARMAFAIATIVRPEILIVDEVLSVGDAAFQRKCEGRITELLSSATTLLLVSHSASTITQLCKNAIWLRKGEVAMIGEATEVCEAYAKYYE